MLTELIEVFDPCVSTPASMLNWTLALVLLVLIYTNLWSSPSLYLNNHLNTVYKLLAPRLLTKFNAVHSLALGLILLTFNYSGLIHIFRVTSNTAFNLPLRLFVVGLT